MKLEEALKLCTKPRRPRPIEHIVSTPVGEIRFVTYVEITQADILASDWEIGEENI